MIQKLVNYINRAHLRFMAICCQDYSSQEITDAIKMYYDIVREMTHAQTFDEIKSMFIDIEIFQKRFKNLIPRDMYDERVILLQDRLTRETERVMHIKKRPCLQRKNK